MNYCSHCGSSQLRYTIPENEHVARYICLGCNKIHYQNPKIVVGCLAVQAGKILLCRRAISPRKGYWNLPAGFMELHETAEEGAKRETREETHAEVEIVRLHSVYSVVHVNQVMLHFLAEIITDDFQINDESSEIRLFSPEQIPWEELAFSSNRFALEKYLSAPSQGQATHLGHFIKQGNRVW